MRYNFVFSCLDRGRMMLGRWIFNVDGKINGNLLAELEDYIEKHAGTSLSSKPVIISWQKLEEDDDLF